MCKLSEHQIKTIFNKTKYLAQKEFRNKNYELSLKYVETAAEIAYTFNWIYFDEELENLILKISAEIITKKPNFIPIQGRIVFYDVFALDNRGLTQQYLRALISWGVEILFVYEGYDLANSKQILSEIKAYSKAELFVVESSLTKVKKIEYVYNKILAFKPEKAFLHLHPSSVVAVSIWNALKEVTRYQINLTDHAFWLGTKCIDYLLEFRDYGCTVSIEKRGLSQSMLLVQPYYPIMDCKSFVGFPELIPKDSIKIFTGGAYYKMYGKSNMFFKLLKTLIELHSQVIILMAGNGDEVPILKFIKDNNFQNRLFLLGSRPDITHVFENCDIYLSTYPITGGLMGQYAASLAKPILSFSSEDIPCNFTEGFINWNRNAEYKITHMTLDSFLSEALKLIESKSYRERIGQEIKKYIITEKDFSVSLKQLVTFNKMEKPFIKEIIDYNVISDLFLETENNYLNKFNFFIVTRFKFRTFYLFPQTFLAFIFEKKFRSRFVSFIIKFLN